MSFVSFPCMGLCGSCDGGDGFLALPLSCCVLLGAHKVTVTCTGSAAPGI